MPWGLSVAPTDPIALADCRHPITEAGLANLTDKLVHFRRLDLTDPEAVTILDRTTDADGRTWLRSVHTHPHWKPERPFAHVEVLYDPETLLPRSITSYDWPRPGQADGPLLAEHYAYDDLDRLTALAHARVGGPTLASYAYDYDAADRLVAETNAEGSFSYGYDALGHVLTETLPGNRTITYTYEKTFNTWPQSTTMPPNEAGVRLVERVGFDPRFDQIYIRGFETTTTGDFRDGLRQPYMNYGTFPTEVYGLERIEILKGPVSVMYGAAGAGGIVNRISKMPEEEPHREVELQYGTIGRAQAAFDKLAPSHRREHLRVITEAKKPETRERRILRMRNPILFDLRHRGGNLRPSADLSGASSRPTKACIDP